MELQEFRVRIAKATSHRSERRQLQQRRMLHNWQRGWGWQGYLQELPTRISESEGSVGIETSSLYIYIESASNPMRDLGMLHAAEAALIFLISAVWKEVLLRNPKENATLRSLRSVCLDCLRPAWSHVLHPRFTKTVDRLCSRLKRSQGYSWRLPSSGQISKSWRLIRCLLLSHLQHARKRAMNNSGGSVIPTLVGWDFGNLRLRLCDLANH